MNDSFDMYLQMEHINPDLPDVDIEVEIDVYKGTTEGGSSDDPSDLTILKVTMNEERKYIENGVTYTLYKGDEIKILDSKMKEQIYEWYENKNNR